MAELATIATVVQLADLALRMSGEVCKFLDAYKSTDRDVKLLRDGTICIRLHRRLADGISIA